MKLWGFIIMAIGFGMHGTLLWHFALFSFASTAAILLVKVTADYKSHYQILVRSKKTEDLNYFYWFESYYTLYILALPFLVFFGGTVVWKGRQY